MTRETTEVLFARYGPRYRWLATGTVMLGTISAVLTSTTVNVAIADIMGAFGIGQDRAQWLSTGALAAMTVGMLLNAWLLRSFGQRKVFVVSLCVFVVALALAGMAPNENLLIFCRIVQGGVAGLLQPLSMYTLFQVFPPNRRGAAMGWFGMSVILGPALGPTLGGVMIEHFNWRYIFYLAMPSSAAGILLGSLFMPEREATGPRPHFDWLGFALLTTSLGCLLTGLSNGQREGWHTSYILGLLFTAGGGALAFLAWELHVAQPLVDLRVFLSAQFSAAAAVAWVVGVGLFGSVYLVPLFVQTVQHFTPMEAGLLLMPAGVALGVFTPISGYLCDHISARKLIITGLLLFGISSFSFAVVDSNTPFWVMAWWVVLSRAGFGFIKPSLNVTALRALRPQLLDQGAGMINFMRQLGGAFGVNLLSVILDRRTFFYSDVLTSMQTAANSATAELLRQIEAALAQAGLPPELQGAGAAHFLGRVVYAQASTLGFRDSFFVCAVIFMVALIPAWIMGRTPPPAAVPEAAAA